MSDPRHSLDGEDTTLLPGDDPILAGVSALRDQVRDAEERAVTAATEAAGDAGDERGRQATDRRARRFWLPLILAASVASSILTAIVVDLVYGPRIDALATENAAQTATDAEIRELVGDARTRADVANAELIARGLPPVPIAAPGQAPAADVLVDAAAAQVLAALPPAQAAAPSAEQLAAAVATFLRANPITPIGPTPAQIAAEVADYLESNPPRDGVDGDDGDRGERGQPGLPPTAEEIQAALVEFLADNPDVLCVRGGAFVLVQGALTTGGTVDFWTCVTGTGTLPAPDNDGGGGLLDLGGG